MAARRRMNILHRQLTEGNQGTTKDHEMMRKIRDICGPFNHHGHIVGDIRKAMDDWLAIGIGPWFFFTHDREQRWDEQVKKGGGRKGALRPTQLHYGTPTAYRALIAFAYNGETGIELIQPYNDEPSCHNDWLRTHGNGLQHINFTCPKNRYVELVDSLIAAGWVPSIQLIEGSGKPGEGPPGRPDMPTVHYFDLMKEFGYHIEISMGGSDDIKKMQKQQAYLCHITKQWDGVTEPIRYTQPRAPKDWNPDEYRFG